MPNLMLKTVIFALAIALPGCGDREAADPDSAAASTPGAAGAAGPGAVVAGGDLRWRNETYRELDGDEENAERLVATVSKGELDSTMVRLEIRTSKDRILYRHEWPAVSYVKYGEAGSARDSAVVFRAARREMGRIFRDSAFVTGADAFTYTGKKEPDLDAIRYDLAEHELRTAKSLKRWDKLTPAAYAELEGFARAVAAERIQRVAAETRAMPAFRYYAGGEESYVVAWSTSEGRMVRIAACC